MKSDRQRIGSHSATDPAAAPAPALAGLGIESTWECLAVGGLMGAKLNCCEHHYEEVLQRMHDHITAELVKEQMN